MVFCYHAQWFLLTWGKHDLRTVSAVTTQVSAATAIGTTTVVKAAETTQTYVTSEFHNFLYSFADHIAVASFVVAVLSLCVNFWSNWKRNKLKEKELELKIKELEHKIGK